MNLRDMETSKLEQIEKRCRIKRNELLRCGWIADRCLVELNKRIIERRHEWKIVK